MLNKFKKFNRRKMLPIVTTHFMRVTREVTPKTGYAIPKRYVTNT